MYVDDYIKSYKQPDCHICSENGMCCRAMVCTLSMRELHELDDYDKLWGGMKPLDAEDLVTPCCETCREYMMCNGKMVCTHANSDLYECGEVPIRPATDVCSFYEISFIAYETAKEILQKGKQNHG